MYITIIPNFKIEPISALAVCSGGNASYKLAGYGIGLDVEWRGSANMTLISGQGTANAIFKSTGNGAGIVSAFIKYKGENFICENSRVWIGPEASPTIDGDLGSINTARLNSEYGFYAKGLPRNTIGQYRWGYGAKNSLKYIETDINFVVLKSPSSGTSFMVTLSVENPCGWSPPSSIVYRINSGGKDKGPVYPLKNALVIDEDQPEIKSVKIYNLSGVLVYSDNAVDGSFDIKSTVLTDGVYIIEKFDGENRTSEKVMLKR
ncbi:T9SS type A sorting domain-containing protein [Dysgonomonas sp. HDW5A]|uniref:T9SS type A sorting domain-containing protein n=1 Tax=Dysgonomonas sp. HDW5A TaxID=2714926 RepID=UPI0014083087|nr:T9SS type A sorting domain-containing protein [Dysgonomonas sp. HDW5A]QIK61487.1 T9SS type A sorting domain-containing protein [Dysgonomonas sp. HDW5A]